MFARVLLSLATTTILAGPLTAQTRLTIAPTGTEARYMVRELLAANTIENDVVGRTEAVTGSILLDAVGMVVPAESRITVNLTGLATDQSRRDGYVQRNLLATAEYPTTTLQVTELRGVQGPFPASGTFTFTLVGDLTIKGVTRPTTWTGTAVASRTGVTGTAKTAFTFADFELTKPQVRVVARVDDPITLELQFNFLRQ